MQNEVTGSVHGEKITLRRDQLFVRPTGDDAGQLMVRDNGVLRPASEAERAVACNAIAGMTGVLQSAAVAIR